jgi:hypothetical protein
MDSMHPILFKDMNTRKMFAMLTALISGGLFVTIGSLASHAEAALTYDLTFLFLRDRKTLENPIGSFLFLLLDILFYSLI